MVKITTTLLRSQLAWLQGHAHTDKEGRLRCSATGTDILSHVRHRYRLASQGPDAPYIEEASLPEVQGSEGGSMVHFSAFACPTCNVWATIPEHVRRSDLVFLREGNIVE